ncbi:FAD-dependent oxidoreductase [Alcaligenaceae bacterium]|nr:FAD-dependent oxidoreductase [Alcaligenaceae bacterium]
MKVAVVGAGWAGLSAAVELRKQQCQVTVFEASHTLGGRARRVQSPAITPVIDNGQHILLGAYSQTLALMQTLGLNDTDLFLREHLHLESADGSFCLRTKALPAPLHLLHAVITAKGLSLREKLKLILLTRKLQNANWRVKPGLSVAAWLHQGGQSQHVIQQFWQPLCLAAMNTPIMTACAQLFAHVLKDSLGGKQEASDTLIPRVDLSALWPDQVALWDSSLQIHMGQPVRQLMQQGSAVLVNDEIFDAVVVASNVPSALRLLTPLADTPQASNYLQCLRNFDYLPIATLTLQLAKPWGLPRAMMMLHEDPIRLHFGQWLFDRSVFIMPGPKQADTTLSVVISDARQTMSHTKAQVIDGIIEQITEQAQRFGPMPTVQANELIIEKRASFAATPGLQRPDCQTPWPQVYVAGDWTDTGYPGVLEGAVRSGQQAARLVCL